MRKKSGSKLLMLFAGLGMMLAALPAAAQDAEEQADRRPGRRRMRNPEMIQERIDEMLERGIAEDDPRIERLRRMQEAIEQGEFRGRRGVGEGQRDRPGQDRFRNRARFGPQEIREFVDQNAELRELFSTMPDGSAAPPEHLNRNLRRFGRQISEIIAALEEGKQALSELMIASAGNQFAIAQKLREYREVSGESASKQVMHAELKELVGKQVEIELGVEALRLQDLRVRLAEQEQRLSRDRRNQDELTDKRLDRLLTRGLERERRGGRARLRDRQRPRPDGPDQPDQ